ncbi:MAG TPA: hypothetical protein VMT85_22720 [Thermoanaerobaculia bacterium]|nr:hypothetical protein [Thermoanaerobaculia bacterium]
MTSTARVGRPPRPIPRDLPPRERRRTAPDSLIRGLLSDEHSGDLDRESAALRREPGAGRGVHIDLTLFSLGELLGILGRSRASGIVEVVGEELGGTLHLVGGGRAVAWAGGLRGLDASLALLDVERGLVRYRHDPHEAPDGEAFLVEDALLQQAWLRDGLSRRSGCVPADDDVIGVRPGARRPAREDPTGLPLRGLWDIVSSAAPIAVCELERLELCAPRRLRLALACLIENRLLVRRPAEPARG